MYRHSLKCRRHILPKAHNTAQSRSNPVVDQATTGFNHN